jgi:hypothetical protein
MRSRRDAGRGIAPDYLRDNTAALSLGVENLGLTRQTVTFAGGFSEAVAPTRRAFATICLYAPVRGEQFACGMWWWKLRSALWIPTYDNRASALISLVGFAASVAAVALPVINRVAWALGILGALTALFFFVDIVLRSRMMRYRSLVHRSLRPGDFLRAPVRLLDTVGYRFVAPKDSSADQLYPYVDISDGTDAIRGANPDLTREERRDLYRRWFQACPRGFLHLERLELKHWVPMAVAIALPVAPAALERIRSVDPKRQKKVIDLEGSDLAHELGTEADCLLIDTWIVHKDYRGEGHGKTQNQGGWGNSLVLRLIAQFWGSTSTLRNPRFLIETKNRPLIDALQGLGLRQAGTSKTDEWFLETDVATLRGVLQHEYRLLVGNIDALGTVPIQVGTAVRL